MASIQLPKRVFGKVDEYGGELVASRFWRLWCFPLLPRGSIWISPTKTSTATEIRWHWRSIAAAYLRTWAPILWLVAFSYDSSRAYTISGVAVALCAWSWTWRMAHRKKAQLRADFDLVTLGSQCPPQNMLPRDVERLFAKKQEAFAARGDGRSPDDVARFGSDDLDELLDAYAVLRLAAVQRKPSGPWLVASQRIIDGRHDAPEASDGVFRSRSIKGLTGAQIAGEVQARAARLRAQEVIEASQQEKTFVQYALWGSWLHVVGYVALALFAWKGADQILDVRDPDQYEVITERRLRDTIAVGTTEYRVRCEEFHLVSAALFGGDDVYACKLGSRYLPVLTEDGEGVQRIGRGALVRGRMLPRRVFRHDAPTWEHLFQTSKYEDHSAVVYLRTDVFSKVGQLTLALSYLFGAPLLLVLWIRLRRQRARTITTAQRLLDEATGR